MKKTWSIALLSVLLLAACSSDEKNKEEKVEEELVPVVEVEAEEEVEVEETKVEEPIEKEAEKPEEKESEYTEVYIAKDGEEGAEERAADNWGINEMSDEEYMKYVGHPLRYVTMEFDELYQIKELSSSGNSYTTSVWFTNDTNWEILSIKGDILLEENEVNQLKKPNKMNFTFNELKPDEQFGTEFTIHTEPEMDPEEISFMTTNMNIREIHVKDGPVFVFDHLYDDGPVRRQ